MKKTVDELRQEAKLMNKHADQMEEDELNKKTVTRKEFITLQNKVARLVADIEALRSQMVPFGIKPYQWPPKEVPKPYW